MQFSGKITNSLLLYLARFGWDQERLFELTEIPLEFLRDPTSWIAASEVETLLGKVDAEFQAQGEHVLTGAGHASSEVRGWGVLDSVLRMMKRPQDIFSQPHRFISYFVSPAPPIANLNGNDESVRFDLPISHQEYPCTVAYLSAALEGLPRYWSQENAQVLWRNTTVKISWSEAQNRLLAEGAQNHRPELVESLVQGVEMAQAQVEARDLEIARLEQEVRELKTKMTKLRHSNAPTNALSEDRREGLRGQLEEIRENVLRLADYLTRSHQAITLAKIAHRQDPQVQAVLRRIDWETIRSQYPWVNLQIMEGLNAAEQMLNSRSIDRPTARSGKVNIQEILDSVVAKLESSESGKLKIRQKSFIEEPVAIDADRAHVVLWQVLSAAAREMKYSGEVEILARKDGQFVEVVIGEKGENLGVGDLEDLPLFRGEVESGHVGLTSAAELIKQHHGEFFTHGDSAGSRQFICRWPVAET